MGHTLIDCFFVYFFTANDRIKNNLQEVLFIKKQQKKSIISNKQFYMTFGQMEKKLKKE